MPVACSLCQEPKTLLSFHFVLFTPFKGPLLSFISVSISFPHTHADDFQVPREHRPDPNVNGFHLFLQSPSSPSPVVPLAPLAAALSNGLCVVSWLRPRADRESRGARLDASVKSVFAGTSLQWNKGDHPSHSRCHISGPRLSRLLPRDNELQQCEFSSELSLMVAI